MRRKFCFEVNAGRIAGEGRLYLWTFTRRECDALIVARKEWHKLLIYLRRKLPAWAGIRVFELHKGKWNDPDLSHGLHVHVICNAFHDVNLVREAAIEAGWGRINVKRIKANRWRYVAKYLFKKRPEVLKGWRLWSCFNLPDRSRLRDIVIDTVRARLFSHGFVKYGQYWRGLRWNEKLSAVSGWHREHIEGRRLSTPVCLTNRGGYDQSKMTDFRKPLFSFVAMGAKQGHFNFPAGALGGTQRGGMGGTGVSPSRVARISPLLKWETVPAAPVC